MTTIFIPEIGTHITNPKNWTFWVINDDRNAALFEAEGVSMAHCYGKKVFQKTFPKDSVFKIDRIYVRKGNEAYSSVSMLIVDTTEPKQIARKKSKRTFGRFFCSLSEFNKAGFLKK